MKRMKQIGAVLLAVLLVVVSNTFAVTAFAGGTGTAADPYQITTAAQMQAINDDVTAHYILMANIDLAGVDFTPIGNAQSGAFSGSFDGNGYTIANLDVFAGKYAGLFGCNEGIVRDVTLSNVYVYGTRYVGGVVGENTAYGTVENCTVQSGLVESDGGINNICVGGVVGMNSGTLSGTFANGAEVSAANPSENAYAGGIVGYTAADLALTAANSGAVSADAGGYAHAGGLVGRAVGDSEMIIQGSSNNGDVFATAGFRNAYAGGLIGYVDDSTSTITIINSANHGNLHLYAYSTTITGGLIGYVESGVTAITILNSYNTGNVDGGYAGGLIGYSGSNATITNSYNTGNIDGSSYAGGLVGYVGSSSNSVSATITNSYNTGNVTDVTSGGGLVGYVYEYERVIITNSYNTGDVSRGGLVGETNRSVVTITNSYTLNEVALRKNIYGSSGTLLTDAQMQTAESFVGWDFTEIWSMGGSVNNGYPVLQAAQSPLQLNVARANLLSGRTLQLQAYRNGVPTDAVTWSVTSGSAVVSRTGLVTASGTGFSTVTAVDADGNKANCSLYSMTANTAVYLNDFTLTQGETNTRNVALGVGSSGDFLTQVTSANPDVVRVNKFGGTQIYFTAVSPGATQITFETAQGFRGSCTATVTNAAQSISLPSSLTVARGASAQLSATTSPTVTSSTVTWSSANPSVATVDETGRVTGVSLGETTVTARTDNGHSDSCVVTVNAPCTAISFTENYIVMENNTTHQLSVQTNPADTTSSVSYRTSSSSSISVSSTGLVTAKRTGLYTVYATANGNEASCTVRVVDALVEATDITLSDTEKTLLAGDTFRLEAQLSPENVTDTALVFTSDDPSVAQIEADGTVTAVSAGITLLRVTASNGVSAVCMLTVRDLTEENGERCFDIYTPQDLLLFAEYVNTKAGYSDLNARLCANLDMSAVCSAQTGVSFTPIGSAQTPYTGSFDGGGFAICDLYVSAGEYAGLFGALGAAAEVQNLRLENAEVHGSYYVGGLAGRSEGRIQAVSVSGTVAGDMYVGGITGYNAGGTIDVCANTASLSAQYIVGGIAGYNRSAESAGRISNAYSAATITTDDYRAGGICGVNDDTVVNSFFDCTRFDGAPIGFGANTSLPDAARPTEAFAGGAITVALNTPENTVFYQTLGEDTYPTLDASHKTVYAGYANCADTAIDYANTPLSEKIPHHSFANGVCTVCGAQQSLHLVESDMHVEGLSAEDNTVTALRMQLETDTMYVEIRSIAGTLLTETDRVGTGATVTFYNRADNAVVQTYTVILYGDVNGDGYINETDRNAVLRVAVGVHILENEWFTRAADVNGDTAIDGFDAAVIDLHIAGASALAQVHETL